MKCAVAILSFAILIWPLSYQGAELNLAHAGYNEVLSTTSTSTSTGLNSAPDNQSGSQDNNAANNQAGGDEAAMLGMIAIAGGIAMMAAGSSMMGNPATAPAGTAMMAAGAVMLAAGMAGMAASSEMANNQAASQVYSDNLQNGGISPPTKTALGSTALAPLKIDPSLIDNPRAQEILTDMQAKSGISPQALADTLNSGGNPLDLLANSKAMQASGNNNVGKLQSMLDAASSAGLPSGGELTNNLGLSAADLAQLAKSDNAYNTASGASRSPASATNANGVDFSAFGSGGKDSANSSGGLGPNGKDGKLSAGLQSALDRSGITSRTLFQMVHMQYKQKTPMLFGNPSRKAATPSENPFSDLNKDQVEL